MKRTLFIALFFLLSVSLYGQKIHFTDSSNTWKYFNADLVMGTCYCSTEYDLFSSSTTISGKKWMVFNSFAYNEDTIAGKVYFMTLPDTADVFLLYDYSLAPGDTIVNQTNELAPTYPILTTYNIVLSTDSTEINGLWYKIWYMGTYNPPNHSSITYNFTVIEAIGCVNGYHAPCNPLPHNEGATSQLECFENKGVSSPLSHSVEVVGTEPVYDFYFDNSSSCNLDLSTAHVSKGDGKAVVFPDPIDETSKISFPEPIVNGSLTVVNETGQTIINTTFQNKQDLLISNTINIAGVYFYRVADEQNGKTYTGRFIAR